MAGIQFVRGRRSYWGEPPLACTCGAILPIRADKVRVASQVTCTACGAQVTFDAEDVAIIAEELARLQKKKR